MHVHIQQKFGILPLPMRLPSILNDLFDSQGVFAITLFQSDWGFDAPCYWFRPLGKQGGGGGNNRGSPSFVEKYTGKILSLQGKMSGMVPIWKMKYCLRKKTIILRIHQRRSMSFPPPLFTEWLRTRAGGKAQHFWNPIAGRRRKVGGRVRDLRWFLTPTGNGSIFEKSTDICAFPSLVYRLVAYRRQGRGRRHITYEIL